MSQQQGEQITAILGQLTKQELADCLKALEIQTPAPGKQFWQSSQANAGIYIITTGKVRLLDNADNLITTLREGDSFGELTLFPQAFESYTARASTKLQVGYIPSDVLQALMDTSNSIRDRLFIRAELTDLLLFCCQSTELTRAASIEGMIKALSLFKRHNLPSDTSAAQKLTDSKLWLLRRGELVHADGRVLSSGNIYYGISESTHFQTWQANQPTILYSLSEADWHTALEHWPELAELTATAKSQDQPPLKANPDNIVPFPLPSSKEPSTPRSRSHFPSPKVQIGHWWGRLNQRYPFLAQQSASDCGAACLVMIGRYWGKRFSLNRLRELASVSRSGSSLRGLTTAAEIIGFSTRPVKASLDKLAQQPLPAIAHWENKHYIVVYEINKKHVIVGDPAIGQRTLSAKEFIAGWTGYALLLQPTAQFKETSESNQSFWQFWELLKPHSVILLEVFTASLFIQIFGLVTPLFTQLLLDRVIVQGSQVTLTAVGCGLVIFGLFRVAMTGLRQYLLDQTANRVGVALLVGFIRHTFRLPL